MDLHREHRCRRAAGFSVLPLLGVLVSFFLPAVRACNSVTTPAHEVANGAYWGLPPFALAAFFAIATLASLLVARSARRPRWRAWLGPYRQHAPAQERPPAPGARLARAAMALCSLGVIALPLTMLLEPGKDATGALLLFGGCGVYIGLLRWLAPRLDGWTRWAVLLLFWAAQAAFPAGAVLAGNAFCEETPGATLYVLSVGAVAVAAIGALVIGPLLRRRARRRGGASSPR